MNPEIIPNSAPVPPVSKLAGLKQLAIGFFQKIYQNKKIFWLITALFSLIILITIAGIIFKLTTGKAAKVTQTPTPVHLNKVNETEEKKEPLDLAKEELETLDARIKGFDINQKRLSPPSVNFKIAF